MLVIIRSSWNHDHPITGHPTDLFCLHCSACAFVPFSFRKTQSSESMDFPAKYVGFHGFPLTFSNQFSQCCWKATKHRWRLRCHQLQLGNQCLELPEFLVLALWSHNSPPFGLFRVGEFLFTMEPMRAQHGGEDWSTNVTIINLAGNLTYNMVIVHNDLYLVIWLVCLFCMFCWNFLFFRWTQLMVGSRPISDSQPWKISGYLGISGLNPTCHGWVEAT